MHPHNLPFGFWLLKSFSRAAAKVNDISKVCFSSHLNKTNSLAFHTGSIWCITFTYLSYYSLPCSLHPDQPPLLLFLDHANTSPPAVFLLGILLLYIFMSLQPRHHSNFMPQHASWSLSNSNPTNPLPHYLVLSSTDCTITEVISFTCSLFTFSHYNLSLFGEGTVCYVHPWIPTPKTGPGISQVLSKSILTDSLIFPHRAQHSISAPKN